VALTNMFGEGISELAWDITQDQLAGQPTWRRQSHQDTPEHLRLSRDGRLTERGVDCVQGHCKPDTKQKLRDNKVMGNRGGLNMTK